MSSGVSTSEDFREWVPPCCGGRNSPARDRPRGRDLVIDAHHGRSRRPGYCGRNGVHRSVAHCPHQWIAGGVSATELPAFIAQVYRGVGRNRKGEVAPCHRSWSESLERVAALLLTSAYALPHRRSSAAADSAGRWADHQWLVFSKAMISAPVRSAMRWANRSCM